MVAIKNSRCFGSASLKHPKIKTLKDSDSTYVRLLVLVLLVLLLRRRQLQLQLQLLLLLRRRRLLLLLPHSEGSLPPRAERRGVPGCSPLRGGVGSGALPARV